MNFDPSKLQALYQQYAQQNPQAAQQLQSMMQEGRQDPKKIAQALMQFQKPNAVDATAQQYGIQPGMSLI